MNYEDIASDEQFLEWFKYEPHDAQYARFAVENPSAIAAGHKISDVFSTFSEARTSLMFSFEKNYGDLAKEDDEISNRFVKALLLKNAIFQYAVCEDLSWQVAWAYIQPANLEYLMKNEYEKMYKECNRDNLLQQFDCAISQKVLKASKIKEILTTFDNDEKMMKFRTLYNFLKHRGTIHIEELGNQDKQLMIQINGQNIDLLSKESYSIEAIQNIIWEYHVSFEDYFNKLILEIMPVDYCDNSINFNDYLNASINMAIAQGKITMPE